MWRVGFLQVWIWCCRACLVFCSEGGYFNAIMSFPPNYPNSPPSVRFTSDMWHPNGEYSQTGRYCFEDIFFSFFLVFLPYNLSLKSDFVCKRLWRNVILPLAVCLSPVYPDGRVCISILHAPGDDPNGYELASERWSPVHTVNFSCELLTLASENGENTHHIQPCLFGYCHEHTISGKFLDRR